MKARGLGVGVAAAIVVLLVPSGLAVAAGPYTLPYHDHTTGIERGYSASHKGIDYKLNFEPVAAARQGVVADLQEGYEDIGACAPVEGNYVLIRHPDGQHTLYLHLKKNGVSVNVGDSISAGQTIATSGNSGFSCGPHLHYGVFVNEFWRVGSNALNPSGRWTTPDSPTPEDALGRGRTTATVEVASTWPPRMGRGRPSATVRSTRPATGSSLGCPREQIRTTWSLALRLGLRSS